MDGFTFFRSYFDVYSNISDNSQKSEFVKMILEYMFLDKDYSFDDALKICGEGGAFAWISLKPSLLKSKNRSKSGGEGKGTSRNKGNYNAIKIDDLMIKETWNDLQLHYLSHEDTRIRKMVTVHGIEAINGERRDKTKKLIAVSGSETLISSIRRLKDVSKLYVFFSKPLRAKIDVRYDDVIEKITQEINNKTTSKQNQYIDL